MQMYNGCAEGQIGLMPDFYVHLAEVFSCARVLFMGFSGVTDVIVFHSVEVISLCPLLAPSFLLLQKTEYKEKGRIVAQCLLK